MNFRNIPRTLALLTFICTSIYHTTATTNPAASHEQGRDIYNFRCYYCHGYSGDAKTLASSFLTTRPRDFTAADAALLTRAQMIHAVSKGIQDTAMKGFETVISPTEVELVVDFVRQEFIFAKAVNTLYHTTANGWPDHDRYTPAFPFATGAIALDTPDKQLTAEQLVGKRLFLDTCISCHDRGRVIDEGPHWDRRALSFPRNHYSHKTGYIDGVTGPSIYAEHDLSPQLDNLSPIEQRGEQLFQVNCTFCHGGTGTGKNWIGSFLEPHPRDLTDPEFMREMTRARLRLIIREGLIGTSMPAWKHVLNESEIEATIHYINRAFHPLAD